MAHLTHEIQVFIVQSLAGWKRPSKIVKDVKAEFDIVIDRRHVDFYNPHSKSNKRLAQVWKDLFAETRKAYLNGTLSVGIAYKSFRLEMLHRIAEEAEERGQTVLALNALEQAAKEQGGLFTNRRKVEVEPRTALANLLGLTPDELPLPEDKEWTN